VLPGAKVSDEIAATRGVPVGRTVVSPPAHSAFSTPTEFVQCIAILRRLSGGKPVQAVHRRSDRVPVDLQGDPGDRHRAGFRHRRRL